MPSIVVAAFCVNVAWAQSQSSINPASVYQQDGVTFASPNQAGWALLKSDKLETVFEKRDEGIVSKAMLKTLKTGIFGTDKERLTRFEALKKEELSNLNLDSVHFNYVPFKRLMCLQYDGIFKLKAGAVPTFEYFNVRGYVCPHPTVKDSAVEMEFSNYANNRGLTEDLSFLTDEFFQRVVFLKAADKN